MSGAKAAKARQANPNRRKEIAWILYDVGNSAFTTTWAIRRSRCS